MTPSTQQPNQIAIQQAMPNSSRGDMRRIVIRDDDSEDDSSNTEVDIIAVRQPPTNPCSKTGTSICFINDDDE